ncbi:AI-2E family transporter [Thiolapillus sp.]|uniref:AI-2E family transporter n=1 Tax=Thiolapillus sp. TaxID=2017437 RepID=UPI003AF68493
MEEKLRQLQSNVPSLYFAAVLICLIYLLWLMVEPFLGAVIFASIITGSIYPVYNIMLEKAQLSNRIAAIIICFLVTVVVFLPMIFLSFALSKEAITLYQNLTAGISNESVSNYLFGEGYIATTVKNIGSILGVEINMERLVDEVILQLKNLSGIAISAINSIVGNIVKILFDFAIMILVIYALLAEGKPLKEFFLKFSPLPDDQEELIIEKFNQMNFVTLVCNGLGGLIQGLLAGIGFWVAGINLVVLWTTIMMILAFIPLLGISIVYIPACIYLAIIGKTFASIALFIYCSVVAFLTENWFKRKRDLTPIYLFRPAIVNLFLVDMPWQQLFDLFQGLRPGQFFKNMT